MAVRGSGINHIQTEEHFQKHNANIVDILCLVYNKDRNGRLLQSLSRGVWTPKELDRCKSSRRVLLKRLPCRAWSSWFLGWEGFSLTPVRCCARWFRGELDYLYGWHLELQEFAPRSPAEKSLIKCITTQHTFTEALSSHMDSSTSCNVNEGICSIKTISTGEPFGGKTSWVRSRVWDEEYWWSPVQLDIASSCPDSWYSSALQMSTKSWQVMSFTTGSAIYTQTRACEQWYSRTCLNPYLT